MFVEVIASQSNVVFETQCSVVSALTRWMGGRKGVRVTCPKMFFS